MGLELVAVDIETTGFEVGDVVTAVGFAVPLGVRVFVQTGGRRAGDVQGAVEDGVDTVVDVSVHESETELLEAVAGFASERLVGRDVLLVGYHGEVWRGGFDLPFLRTRLTRVDVEWPFRDVAYADVLPVVTDRFNTTVDGEDLSGLGDVYAVLCDGGYEAVDPFAESGEAVSAFEDGRFGELAMHNAADVLRTRALAVLAEEYCGKADFQLKRLTPVNHD